MIWPRNRRTSNSWYQSDQQRQHQAGRDGRDRGRERIVEHVQRACDGVAEQLVSGAAEDQRDRDLAERSDETEDRRGEHAGQRERQGHPPEGGERRRAQHPARLQQAPVDARKREPDREDHERHVGGHEAEIDRKIREQQPVERLLDQLDPQQQGVDEAGAAQDVRPGEGAHDVVDQKRHREQEQKRAGELGPDPQRDEIGDRVSDQQHERGRGARHPEAPLEHLETDAGEEQPVGFEGERRADPEAPLLEHADRQRDQQRAQDEPGDHQQRHAENEQPRRTSARQAHREESGPERRRQAALKRCHSSS